MPPNIASSKKRFFQVDFVEQAVVGWVGQPLFHPQPFGVSRIVSSDLSELRSNASHQDGFIPPSGSFEPAISASGSSVGDFLPNEPTMGNYASRFEAMNSYEGRNQSMEEDLDMAIFLANRALRMYRDLKPQLPRVVPSPNMMEYQGSKAFASPGRPDSLHSFLRAGESWTASNFTPDPNQPYKQQPHDEASITTSTKTLSLELDQNYELNEADDHWLMENEEEAPTAADPQQPFDEPAPYY